MYISTLVRLWKNPNIQQHWMETETVIYKYKYIYTHNGIICNTMKQNIKHADHGNLNGIEGYPLNKIN